MGLTAAVKQGLKQGVILIIHLDELHNLIQRLLELCREGTIEIEEIMDYPCHHDYLGLGMEATRNLVYGVHGFSIYLFFFNF